MDEKNENVRVRFAPSPTGYLHVGGLRTALYNYLFAKKHNGTYILRIEDTDRERYVPGAVEALARTLYAVGLNADEGMLMEGEQVIAQGEKGPYIQSERLALYQEYAQKLLAEGKAYYCFCTKERLEEIRKEHFEKKQPPKYDKHCLGLSEEERAEKIKRGEPSVIRLNIKPGETVTFTERLHGAISFDTTDLDDQILVKSDGFPTYHLANVVDDHLMGITQVIRGEEWLPSTPKHILIYEALGWELPGFTHLPLLLNKDKSKLSKRQGHVAVEDFLKEGYLPEALLNFVALLGWNPGEGSTQEIFSLDELIELFELSHVHKGGAVFDEEKLRWMNGEYIKALSLDDLFARMEAGEFFEKDFIKELSDGQRSAGFLRKVLVIEQERLQRLADFGEENKFLFVNSSMLRYDKALLAWKENSLEETSHALAKALAVLGKLTPEEWGSLKTITEVLMEAAGENRGDFLWPLRVALTGEKRSPSPMQVAWALGPVETILRLEQALLLVGKSEE